MLSSAFPVQFIFLIQNSTWIAPQSKKHLCPVTTQKKHKLIFFTNNLAFRIVILIIYIVEQQ